jgi:hypothetical protein
MDGALPLPAVAGRPTESPNTSPPRREQAGANPAFEPASRHGVDQSVFKKFTRS